MDALGPEDDSASLASSTRSLDLRRLSTRVDSAYSSFSAASGGPEPRTPSPETDPNPNPNPDPYLDWDYVPMVWGDSGPTGVPPAAGLRTCPRPAPAPPALGGPHLPELQGDRGTLSKQATPLLFALAAEAEAAARAEEPPSPPASRAAYRQRLQGAQRRVLRETSFQRKELRMSLPARLRPSTAHPRSPSLSHPVAEVELPCREIPAPGPGGRRLSSQQRDWCFSDPGKLDRMGQGAGPAGKCPAEACSASGLIWPESQGLQPGVECEGHQVRRLPGTQVPGTADPPLGSWKLREPYKRASRRSPHTSGKGLGHWGDPGGIISNVQVVAAVCPAKSPQDSPADCEQRVPARLPSLPHDDVYLEEAPWVPTRSSQDTYLPQELPTSACASDQQDGADLDQRAGQVTVTPEQPPQDSPAAAGADGCWQGVNGSVGDSGVLCCDPSETENTDNSANDPSRLLVAQNPAVAESGSPKPLPVDALLGSSNQSLPGHTALAQDTGKPGYRPLWSHQRLEELVQELARLDPSLSDTLTAQPNPQPPLDVLDGLIPLAEIWAAMQPACGETGEVAAGTSEPRSCLQSSGQFQTTSQEETSAENPTACPIPDQRYGQAPSEPTNSIQAKKGELADLLRRMLLDLQAEQERLRSAAQACSRRSAALESVMGQTCTPRELERFRRFMADLERVLGLLLLLASRLARVRSALIRVGSNGDPEERRLRLLERQQEDAKELKEHVARRERALRQVLARTLAAEELRAYCGLLASKAALLARQRSLDEQLRLLQDQLDVISGDLGHRSLASRPAWPPGSRPQDKPPFPPPFM
ncbi:protein Shroom1 [Tenrec ecaudatus]|uniref:protein Shroom1 n=1 Tax=Tenrec ecaudatus TaxID=94439 RepID=UPI003F5942E6